MTPTITKWHGGKSHLAGRIWDLALSTEWRPIHVVEPYCGGASFTLEGLARGLPYSFVINDLSRELTNFWRVLQDESAFTVFRRQVEATPFSEWEWNNARGTALADGMDVSAAVNFFVCNRQSLAGRMRSFTGITKTRTRRRMNNEVSAWLTVVEGLPEFHSLLKKVLILDARPALDVIRSQDGPGTLTFADPPYLHETRATTSDYQHEMTYDQHAALLTALGSIKGKFLLSGYPSGLYDSVAAEHGWRRVDWELPNNAAGGESKSRMTESVWLNY